MLIFVGISVECHIDYQEKSDRIMITLEVCKFEQHMTFHAIHKNPPSR